VDPRIDFSKYFDTDFTDFTDQMSLNKTNIMKHIDITDKIIKAAFNVHNTLGFGFFEKVYQNAMVADKLWAFC